MRSCSVSIGVDKAPGRTTAGFWTGSGNREVDDESVGTSARRWVGPEVMDGLESKAGSMFQ